ncbi:MAG TPA: hypothetical protein PKE43_04345 [Anaerolineales bacterium]|nr:hypothetical protein [Anaerolineales bacterium]HNA53408.1 hypothetical protein [Anaerolineales bacterium]HNC91820.1 hypothetical protein [Anaerolineales bacterium]HND91298.1 hypothetical protein [Anaerolineales bacterium]HNE68681.1 hypothetical protein [Anaerolineales bacterium]
MKTLHQRITPVILGLLSFLLFAFVPLSKTHGMVRESAGGKADGPDVYYVYITVLNISNIDLSAGTYAVDFFISFICETPPCQYEPHWDVMNATEIIDPEDQGTSIPFEVYDYRLKTSLIGYVDYTFYPFDYLYVDIIIEDKEYSNDELVYRSAAVEVDPMLFNPSGWYYRPEYDGDMNDIVVYPNDDISYDRLYIWLFMERDRFSGFMKTIFAALVIVLVGMLSFLMKAEAAGERLALVSSTLVAVVLYHISLVSGVPATGYLTFIDKFMIGTYAVVFVSLVISVAMMVYKNNDELGKAEKLHLRTRWIIPLLWVFLMVCVFIVELILPYRQMLAANGG